MFLCKSWGMIVKMGIFCILVYVVVDFNGKLILKIYYQVLNIALVDKISPKTVGNERNCKIKKK